MAVRDPVSKTKASTAALDLIVSQGFFNPAPPTAPPGLRPAPVPPQGGNP